MTPAVLLAAAAGMLAGTGLGEVAAARRGRRRPAGARAVAALVALGRRLGAPAPARDLAGRLEAAGRPFGLGPGEMTAVKGACACVALLAGAPLAASLPGRLPVVAFPALGLAGFFGPELVLARRARARRRSMELDLPDLLDLLRVAVEAGLPLGRALAEVGHRHTGMLAREWRVAAAQVQLGVPREEALSALVRRCPAPGVALLAAALARAERHGAPLGETLAAQAREARAERARRIREHAARAAPKIQLAVALLLVPSVLLLVAAALVASLMV